MNWLGCVASYSPAASVLFSTVNGNGTLKRTLRLPLWAWVAEVIREIAIIVATTFHLFFIFIASHVNSVARARKATFVLHLSKAKTPRENCNEAELSFRPVRKWV